MLPSETFVWPSGKSATCNQLLKAKKCNEHQQRKKTRIQTKVHPIGHQSETPSTVQSGIQIWGTFDTRALKVQGKT